MTIRQQELIDTVERLVDSEGLYAMTEALHLMCIEKSEHLQFNWQDKPAAHRWLKAASAFKSAHARLIEIQIP